MLKIKMEVIQKHAVGIQMLNQQSVVLINWVFVSISSPETVASQLLFQF